MKFYYSQSFHSHMEIEKSLLKNIPDEITPHLFLSNGIYGRQFLEFIQFNKIAHAWAALICSSILEDRADQLVYSLPEKNYKQLWLKDTLDESISDFFLESYAFIESSVGSGKKILIFCSAGVSRSPSIMIAYLIRKYQLSFEQAYNHVSYKRPCIFPNRNYIEQLKAYAERLFIE